MFDCVLSVSSFNIYQGCVSRYLSKNIQYKRGQGKLGFFSYLHVRPLILQTGSKDFWSSLWLNSIELISNFNYVSKICKYITSIDNTIIITEWYCREKVLVYLCMTWSLLVSISFPLFLSSCRHLLWTVWNNTVGSLSRHPWKTFVEIQPNANEGRVESIPRHPSSKAHQW